jgi:hypothetical protein
MNSNITIEGLRKSGFKVCVKHHWGSTFGYTVIWVTDPNGNTAFGGSTCNSQDNYNRKLGNKIALGRAMKKLATKDYCTFPIDKAIEL